jgi:hypothetical protein
MLWFENYRGCRFRHSSFDERMEGRKNGRARRQDMATQHTGFLRISKSVTGAALVLFGSLILYENLAGAVAWLEQVLGSTPSAGLGRLPATLLVLSQVLQAYAADHQGLLVALLQRIAVSCWPLLLVTVGTVLSLDAGSTPDKNKTVELSI